MKNIFIIIVLFLGFNTIAAESDSTFYVTDSETERLIDKYSDKIADSFSNAVSSITPIAEDGFKVMVSLHFVSGFQLLLVVIALTILSLYFIIQFQKHINEKDSCGDWGGTKTVFFFLSLISIIVLISVLVGVPILSKLIVPEYYALKELISFIK